MKLDKGNFPANRWLAHTAALRWMIPLAFGIMMAGFAISIGLHAGGWPSSWDDLVLSNLASTQDNPNGWPVATVTATLAGTLLLAASAMFIGMFKRLGSGWGVAGALLYSLGVLSIITWAVSTPLTNGPSQFHINLAYCAYLSSTGGLSLCHLVIARMRTPGRLLSAGSFFLLSIAFATVVYLFFNDEMFDRYEWLLAVTEWAAGILIALTTATLSFAVIRLTSLSKGAN